MSESPAAEVRLAAQIRAHQSWAKTVHRPPARRRLALPGNGSSSSRLTATPSVPNTSAPPTTNGWRSSPPPAAGATVTAGRLLLAGGLRPDGAALLLPSSRSLVCGLNLITATRPDDDHSSRPPR